jgi:hypothetical protein
MKTIPLTQNKFAIVDDEDYEILKNIKWHAQVSKNNTWYAKSRIDRKVVAMHRFICKPSGEYQIDHINGDGLDNRKSNLRACLNSQNTLNRKMSSKNTSGFKGVHKSRDRFRACIRANGKRFHLGYYKSPELAAVAYDDAAVIHCGEFAKTNKSLGLLN